MTLIGRITEHTVRAGGDPYPTPQHDEPLRSLFQAFDDAKQALIAAVRASLDEHVKMSSRGHMPVVPFNWLIHAPAQGPEDFAPQNYSKKDKLQKALVLAARRYLVARDFNEVDPKKADVIWKLQNGGAL